MSPRRRLAIAALFVGAAMGAFPKRGLPDWMVWPMWLVGLAALLTAVLLAFTMLGQRDSKRGKETQRDA
jgi:protein-S-isoprenylcysteine O-methyltransferase Ste14